MDERASHSYTFFMRIFDLSNFNMEKKSLKHFDKQKKSNLQLIYIHKVFGKSLQNACKT